MVGVLLFYGRGVLFCLIIYSAIAFFGELAGRQSGEKINKLGPKELVVLSLWSWLGFLVFLGYIFRYVWRVLKEGN